MGFVRIASTNDLKSGEFKGVEIGGKEILLVNLNGSFYAVGNRCTHRGCMLSNGLLKDENMLCACHGSLFAVKTGAIVKGPAKKPEPVYQLKVDGDQVMANL